MCVWFCLKLAGRLSASVMPTPRSTPSSRPTVIPSYKPVFPQVAANIPEEQVVESAQILERAFFQLYLEGDIVSISKQTIMCVCVARPVLSKQCACVRACACVCACVCMCMCVCMCPTNFRARPHMFVSHDRPVPDLCAMSTFPSSRSLLAWTHWETEPWHA